MEIVKLTEREYSEIARMKVARARKESEDSVHYPDVCLLFAVSMCISFSMAGVVGSPHR